MLKIKPPTCDTCVQLNCLINKHCSPKCKSFLGKNKLFLEYSKKQIIFSESGIVSGVYFIHTGKIKVYNTGEKDEQNNIRLGVSCEMLGLMDFSSKHYLVGAAALEDSSLCFFEKQIFIKIIKENPEFAKHLIEFYTQQLSEIENRHKNFNPLNPKKEISGGSVNVEK